MHESEVKNSKKRQRVYSDRKGEKSGYEYGLNSKGKGKRRKGR